MAKERERFSPPALGGGSLLTVFAVLALTVFALLSLSTVRADVRLGDAAASAVADYYEADGKAQAALACLRTGRPLPADITVYPDGAENIYSYAVPISDKQELQVSVQISEKDYKILRWEAVRTEDWVPDGGLDVWDGEFIF